MQLLSIYKCLKLSGEKSILGRGIIETSCDPFMLSVLPYIDLKLALNCTAPIEAKIHMFP